MAPRVSLGSGEPTVRAHHPTGPLVRQLRGRGGVSPPYSTTTGLPTTGLRHQQQSLAAAVAGLTGSSEQQATGSTSSSSSSIRAGEILTDVTQKKWKLGKSIGGGAFGDIYLASDDLTKPVGSDAKYVVKMEPHSNGPLFVEMNFYLRAAKPSSVDEWLAKRGGGAAGRARKTGQQGGGGGRLGLPQLCGFGSHSTVRGGQRLRFIVLPKYGDSIYKVIQRAPLDSKTALRFATHLLEVLEYVHSQGYIHCDIKSMNLVLGGRGGQGKLDLGPASGEVTTGEPEGGPRGGFAPRTHLPRAEIYLIDFGLATKYLTSDGRHKDDTPDSRKADLGTLEFSSRDSHLGLISRRSDLESLGYNLITWFGGILPWSEVLDSALVSAMKEKAMRNIPDFLRRAFSTRISTLEDELLLVLEEYLDYVLQLEFHSTPDYGYCRRLFSQRLERKPKLGRRKRPLTEDGAGGEGENRHAKRTKFRLFPEEEGGRKRQPCSINTSSNICSRQDRRPGVTETGGGGERLTRGVMKLRQRERRRSSGESGEGSPEEVEEQQLLEICLESFDWASVLAGDPEKNLRRAHKESHITPLHRGGGGDKSTSSAASLVNPTPAMLELIERRKSRCSSEAGSRRSVDSPTSVQMFYKGTVCTPGMRAVLEWRQQQQEELFSQPSISCPRLTRAAARRARTPSRK